MAKNYIQPGRVVTVAAPTGGVSSGDGVLVGSLFGVAQHDAVESEDVELLTEDVVEILINGHSLGARLWSPHVWVGQSSWIKTGKNRVTIRCTNTLSRLLTGKRFNHRSHRIVEVNV